MAPITPRQQARRARVESAIMLAAPFLDLVLAVGDRVSRIAAPEDDYMPIRSPGDAFELGPAPAPQRSREPVD